MAAGAGDCSIVSKGRAGCIKGPDGSAQINDSLQCTGVGRTTGSHEAVQPSPLSHQSRDLRFIFVRKCFGRDILQSGLAFYTNYLDPDLGISMTFGFGFSLKASFSTAVNRSCRSGIQAA